MTRLVWGDPKDRTFETGVSCAVLYVDNGSGVPWNGVVSIVEKSSGGSSRSFFYDGDKYAHKISNEQFEFSIEAFTYPRSFSVCDGSQAVRPGFRIGNQKRKPFHLCYRTLVGDGIESERGYKLHFVYNAMILPSEKTRETTTETTEAALFSWDAITVPLRIDGFRPSAYFEVDSREIKPQALTLLENVLYGTNTTLPRMPMPDEIAGILDLTFDGIELVIHGDGTFTISSESEQITLLPDGSFEIDSESVVVSDDQYTVSTI